MNIRFTPLPLAEIQLALQQHISAFPSPIDSFLEDHILASTHYDILLDDQKIGWTSIYQGSSLTQFALLPEYKRLGQRLFPLVRKLEEVRSALVPTSDEFFLSHALDDYHLLEKQACFFQHNSHSQPYQPPFALRHRQANAADIPTIQRHSGDFFDKIEQRIAEGQLYLTQRAETATDEPLGFGIIDPGRLFLGVGSCGMFTVEAQRNQGLGPAIITHLISRCAELGLRPIAGCWYYNHRSKKTLEKAGMFSQTRLLKNQLLRCWRI